MSDTTKTPDNVIPKRRASDRQKTEQSAKAATDGNLIQRRRTSDWPVTAKRRTVLDGGCVVLAFPGCDLPPVVNKRKGRLPNSIPKLSDERKRRLEQQEWAKAQAQRIAELEGSFHVAGIWIQILRNDLAGMGYDLDGSPMAAKKAGGAV